ncbi:MAG: hypothetical protein MIO92_04560 [Methanosarcinaceae archaeon]|nr:hypothetical protein [Methanosarcinaceae archaeon]
MVTTYKPKKPPKVKPVTGTVIISRKLDDPVSKQIKDGAEAIKLACPDIFKKKDPFPTVRLAKMTQEEIAYEVTDGRGSRAKVGCV